MKTPKTILILVVTVVLLAGCSTKNILTFTPSSSPSTAPLVTPSPSRTGTVTPTRQPSTLTPTPTSLPTTTNTPTAKPKAFQDHCLEVASSLPQNAKLDGVIVLLDNFNVSPTYLLDMETGKKNPLSQKEGEDIEYLKVSPDGKWLAYWSNRNTPGNVSLSDSWLVIATADGKPYKNVPWEEGWRYIAGWLDNERVLINKMGKARYDLDAMIVLDPFTGQGTEFTPDYPKINDTDWVSWNFSRLVFDPTLSWVVYPSYEGNPNSVVLWDVTKSQSIASLLASLPCSPEPSWSPDGTQVILAADAVPNFDTCNQELYSITQDGQITRLTHFLDTYSKADIGNFSWSPDGQRIAFWFWVKGFTSEQLAVLDIATKNMTNYCVPGFLQGGAGRPVWSPDGQQLAVQNVYDENNNSHTILVDIANGWAAKIAENLTPVGWMVSP